jgi:putative ABC transport system permease protein
VLSKSFLGLLDVDLGFDATNVLTVALPAQGFPPGSRYTSVEDFRTHVRQIESAVAALPGVRAAALTNGLPLTDCCLYQLNLEVEGRPSVDRANRGGGSLKIVTPSYFEALGLTLRRGRFLDEHDVAGTTPAIVINERLAARYFGDENPVGRHVVNPAVVPGRTEVGPGVTWEIVGVVANEKLTALDDDTSEVMYATYEQSPAYFTNLVVRADLDAAALEKSVRAAIAAVDPEQGIRDVRTLESIRSASTVADRFQTLLSALFSIMAVLLAAAGVYGVLSYSVAQRSHELAVRSALGASSAKLVRLVVHRGLALTLLGLGVGLGAALAALPLLRSILYHVEARDPRLLLAASGVLVVVGFAACFGPARRAARVDPVQGLRME